MSEQANAQIYRLRELPDLIQQIGEIRNKRMAEYRAELRKYNRRRAGREEVTRDHREGICLYRNQRGFVVTHMGRELFFPKPSKPSYAAWFRFDARRDGGLLAHGGKHNRPVNSQRVNEYMNAIIRGEWQDNLTDPICITPDGEVINGQHRLAAVGQIEFTEPEDGPQRVLVLFDVDPAQITFADTSKRTARDLTVMAAKRASA